MGESDGLSFNVECAVNRLNLTSEQAGFSGQSLSVPNGIPLFLDGSVHQFVVPTIPDTPVSLIARDNQVYELFFQLAHPGQQLTGEYNHYAYSTNSDAPHTSANGTDARCKVEQSGVLYLPVVCEPFQQFAASERASGVEQLPAFDESRAVHCLRVRAPAFCASLDPASVKSAFDLLNISRIESGSYEFHNSQSVPDARLELTFRVNGSDASPLEISYTRYFFNAEESVPDSHVPVTYTRQAVESVDANAVLYTQLETVTNGFEWESVRHVESLFCRVQLPGNVGLLNESESLVSLVQCPTCNVQFLGIKECVEHALVNHDSQCVLCNEQVPASDFMAQHVPSCALRLYNTLTTQTVPSSLDQTALTRLKADLEALFTESNLANASESVASANSALEEVDAEGYMMYTSEAVTSDTVAVQRGRGPIQIYGDFSCKFCGRLCKTYIGLKSHVTQGHREFYNKLLLHTLEKVKDIQLEQVRADSVEAERLRLLEFDAAWNKAASSQVHGRGPAGESSRVMQWTSASYAFFRSLTAEMLQLAFERVLNELQNGVGILNDEVRLERMRSRVGSHDYSATSCSANVIEWRSSVNGEIKRIDQCSERSDAFVAYRRRIQQTTELIKMMERASLGDSNKRGLWNVLDVERLFQSVSGEQVQAASKLPSRYVRGKRPRGRPPKPATLGLPPNASVQEIQQAQLALQAERLKSKRLRFDTHSLRNSSQFCKETVANRGDALSVSDTDSDEVFLARCDVRDGRIVCADCDSLFADRRRLLEHWKVNHRSVFVFACDAGNCQKCFASLALLTEHRQTHLFETVSYSCALCSLTFESEIFLRVHHKQMHKDTQYQSVAKAISSNSKTCAVNAAGDSSIKFKSERDKRPNARESTQQVRVIRATSLQSNLPQISTTAAAKLNVVSANVQVLDASEGRRATVSHCDNASNSDAVNTQPPLTNGFAESADDAEMVYRCGLCEVQFGNLVEVTAHQQELQTAQTFDLRTKELDELRQCERECLANSEPEQPVEVSAETHDHAAARSSRLLQVRECLNALKKETDSAPTAQYFCRICRSYFTSQCVANQHARDAHAKTRRSVEDDSMNCSQVTDHDQQMQISKSSSVASELTPKASDSKS